MSASPETLKDLLADQAALVCKASEATLASTAAGKGSMATIPRYSGPGDLDRPAIRALGRAKRGSGDNAENITFDQAKYQLWEAGKPNSIPLMNSPSGEHVTTLGKLLNTASERSSSARPSQRAV